MAYQQFSETLPISLKDRVTSIETDLQAFEGLIGSHIYAGGYIPLATTSGNDTAGDSATVWLCEVRIPHNTLVTGIQYLIGSVGGTDKAIAILYDSKGNVLANSAVAGVTVGTLATFQALPFTTPYAAGPGLYYVGISTNNNNAKIRTQVFGNHNAGNVTGQVFGTLAAVTPPSSFTANQAPIAMLY